MIINGTEIVGSAPRTMVGAFYRLALAHGHLWPTGQLEGLERLEQELEAAETEEEAAEWATAMSRVSFLLDGPDGMGGVAFPDPGEPLSHVTGSGRSRWTCEYVMGRRAVIFEIDRPNGICLRAKLAWGEDDYGDDEGLSLDLLDIEPESVAEPRHWDALIRNIVDALTRREARLSSAPTFLAVAEALRASAKEDFDRDLPDSYWEGLPGAETLAMYREVGAHWAGKLGETLPDDNDAAWAVARAYRNAALSGNDTLDDATHPRYAEAIAEAMRDGFVAARSRAKAE